MSWGGTLCHIESQSHNTKKILPTYEVNSTCQILYTAGCTTTVPHHLGYTGVRNRKTKLRNSRC